MDPEPSWSTSLRYGVRGWGPTIQSSDTDHGVTLVQNYANSEGGARLAPLKLSLGATRLTSRGGAQTRKTPFPHLVARPVRSSQSN